MGENEDAVLARLYSVLERFEANQSIFREDEIPEVQNGLNRISKIPETFMVQISGFIRQMTDYNVMGYEKANLVFVKGK